jgi:hypothetical protein
VPVQTITAVDTVMCPPDQDGKVVIACHGITTVHVGGHYEETASALSELLKATHRVTDVGACSKSYVNGWVAYRWTNPFGATLAYAQLDLEDWYNGCSAGNVWKNPHCTGYWGWGCDPSRTGSFFDGGRGANADWQNSNISQLNTGWHCIWLRFWTRVNGSWYYASGINDGKDNC